MSTFGFLPGRFTISAWSVLMISKLSSAACLSAIFVPALSLRFPSSFRTSWGTIHSIGSLMILSAMWSRSIFCFVVAMMKFVSSSIFMLM